ncbi:Beta-sesquiphellandrene synthase [Dichanthelium oligosanthes]|uniref:Beta-sesquiphellandrene synthase n=1 Tax=Dichanthelium oligosanthes TaxID=888268 RepID=A0A1E5UJS3_9POAL|nr:Beta-sesquiphellandrene synthase [Dichanthelium oligosanthes]
MTSSTYTAFLPMTLTPSSCHHSRGSRPAVEASPAAPSPILPGAVASSPPGKQMLLVRQVPTGHGWRHPSLVWTTRATGGVVATANTNAKNQPKEREDRASRNISTFHPSIWGDFFLTFSSPLASSAQQQTWMSQRADQLKEEVAKLIAASGTCSLYQRIHLIDVLEHLCLDYLFDEEINDVLTQLKNADVSGCDLQTVAMWFYLLRKHGYRVSPDVFATFRDDQGKFAANNPRDLMCLYNAAYLRMHGEIILDEAISFTTKCLESIVPYMEGSLLANEIKCALEIPLPRRVRIYEAKSYMSAYRKHTEGDELIIELAKLNSNLIQLQHQQELNMITRWWNDLEVQSRLSFARDRVVECYFWIVGVYFEPRYSRGRIILSKVLAIVSILDDTYDVYGTLQECELFTKCIERFVFSSDRLKLKSLFTK